MLGTLDLWSSALGGCMATVYTRVMGIDTLLMVPY